MASLSYLPWNQTRSYNGGRPCRRGRSGRFNREVAWNQAPLEGKGGRGTGGKEQNNEGKEKKEANRAGDWGGAGKRRARNMSPLFPTFQSPA